MVLSMCFGECCRLRRRTVIQFVKNHRYWIFIPICILFNVVNSNSYENRIPDSDTYIYVRPIGLMKELYSENEWIRYRSISFADHFRYPMEIDMTKLAEHRIKGNKSYIRPINEHPFKYLKNPENLCSSKTTGSDIPLLILIKSSAQNHALRNVIRKTWGKEIREKGKYQMAFLIGYSILHQHVVDVEHYKHRDIIQEDFIDTYWNNTYKTIMAFNWASQYCSKARTVLFLDDDMLVNFKKLEKYVSEIDEKRKQILFSGILAERGVPVRDVKSKWYVPWHDYPYDYYPNYLAGSVIFASMSVVIRFQAVFPYVRYFGIDDVYLGIVAYKLNISPSKTSHLDNNMRNFKNLSILIANHGFRDHNLYMETYLNLTSLD